MLQACNKHATSDAASMQQACNKAHESKQATKNTLLDQKTLSIPACKHVRGATKNTLLDLPCWPTMRRVNKASQHQKNSIQNKHQESASKDKHQKQGIAASRKIASRISNPIILIQQE